MKTNDLDRHVNIARRKFYPGFVDANLLGNMQHTQAVYSLVINTRLSPE
jgi:hypothetical protein